MNPDGSRSCKKSSWTSGPLGKDLIKIKHSGRLDPEKKTCQILEDLKKLRENSKIRFLDFWTPKKELNENRES